MENLQATNPESRSTLGVANEISDITLDVLCYIGQILSSIFFAFALYSNLPAVAAVPVP